MLPVGCELFSKERIINFAKTNCHIGDVYFRGSLCSPVLQQTRVVKLDLSLLVPKVCPSLSGVEWEPGFCYGYPFKLSIPTALFCVIGILIVHNLTTLHTLSSSNHQLSPQISTPSSSYSTSFPCPNNHPVPAHITPLNAPSLKPYHTPLPIPETNKPHPSTTNSPPPQHFYNQTPQYGFYLPIHFFFLKKRLSVTTAMDIFIPFLLLQCQERSQLDGWDE